MIPALKAEFRKIFSLRSTYVILALCMALELLFAFYVTGWKLKPAELASHHFLASQVVSAINPLSLLFGLVAVLLVTHEYRYNTITYTLTANRSRSRVFLAKFLAVTAFAVVASVIFGLLSPALSLLAVHIRGLNVGHQDFNTWDVMWRAVFAGWGFSALAFILASIIRIQVGAIAAMFLIPSTVENLLGLLLKGNQAYLPFSALNVLLEVPPNGSHISFARAALVAGAYIVGGWIVAWLLFLRRDAN